MNVSTNKDAALSISYVWKSCCAYAAGGLCPHCGRKGRSHREEGPSHWRAWHCGKGGTNLTSANAICLSQMDTFKRHIQTPPAVGINEPFLLPLCVPAQTGANDLQTLADRLAQQSICASLSRRFPQITIIGEEVSRLEALFCVAVKLDTFTATPTRLF